MGLDLLLYKARALMGLAYGSGGETPDVQAYLEAVTETLAAITQALAAPMKSTADILLALEASAVALALKAIKAELSGEAAVDVKAVALNALKLSATDFDNISETEASMATPRAAGLDIRIEDEGEVSSALTPCGYKELETLVDCAFSADAALQSPAAYALITEAGFDIVPELSLSLYGSMALASEIMPELLIECTVTVKGTGRLKDYRGYTLKELGSKTLRELSYKL